MVTVALGITAPERSVMVPEMIPVGACATTVNVAQANRIENDLVPDISRPPRYLDKLKFFRIVSRRDALVKGVLNRPVGQLAAASLPWTTDRRHGAGGIGPKRKNRDC